MRSRPPLTRRQFLISCLILILFVLLTFLLFSHFSPHRKFERTCKKFYTQEVSSNTLNLHYSLAHPENFGIDISQVILPCYTPGSAEKQSTEIQEKIDLLHTFDKLHLSIADRYACNLLERDLTSSRRLAAFPYYEEPFAPSQGAQNQLPILLSEYTFRSQKDVEDYLSILSQTGDYFASLLIYEEEKAAAGTLMSASFLIQAATECDTIVTSEELEKGTHFLQTGFSERLDTLSETIPISEQEKWDYIVQNNQLLKTVFLPAYHLLSEKLTSLSTQAPAQIQGLSALPDGKAYYTALLSAQTGSSRTPEEVKKLLAGRILSEYNAIRQLSNDYPGCLSSLKSGSYTDLGLEDISDMLSDLTIQFPKDFPMLFPNAAQLPSVTVKTVAPNLEAFCAPAYYLTSPMDKTDTNVVYINQKNALSGLELYTTLAHESFPGHLYQNACSAYFLLDDTACCLRRLIGCGGYMEGWAVYAEQYSYNYASKLLARQKRPADAVCVQIEKHNRSLQLGLYALLDIMIHYDGKTLDETADFLKAFGVTDSAAVSSVYSYICQNPCNYPKYYLGYLEMLELKQIAMELWADEYTESAFHRFLLEWGPADFGSLKEMLSRALPLPGASRNN